MCDELYHPVKRPPPNPNVRLRRSSKDHMQTHPQPLINVKKTNSNNRKLVKQTPLILDQSKLSPSKPMVKRSLSWDNLKKDQLNTLQRSLSASNMYALSDPKLSLKKAAVTKAYDEPNSKLAKEKAQYIAWSQKYYYQLTVGCEKNDCRNKFCRSSKIFSNFNKGMCGILSIELANYEDEFLCIKDKSRQIAKVFDRKIFNLDETKYNNSDDNNNTSKELTLPFLHSFYSTSPFRSLFLPCPLTLSGLGLHKTHSVSELLDVNEKNQKDYSISTHLKSGLLNMANTISSSVSNLLLGSSNNYENHNSNEMKDLDYQNDDSKKAFSFDGKSENPEPKPFLTRTRVSSVRMFSEEYAVDTEWETQDNIDDFESSVAEEFKQNSEIIITESDADDDAVMNEYSLTHLTFDMFNMVVFNYLQCGDESLLINTLRTVFSSWTSLILSFSDINETLIASKIPSIRISDVENMFSKLVSLDKGQTFLAILIDTVKLTLISRKKSPITDPVHLKPLLIIFEIPNLSSQYQLLQEIADIISTLTLSCMEALASYISEFNELKFLNLVKVFLSQLSSEKPLTTLPLKNNRKMGAICKTLKLLYIANHWKGKNYYVIPNEEFYCTEITSKVDFKHEYIFWKGNGGNSNEESVLSYPFLLDPAVKVQVMHIDAITQMREEYQDAIVHQARVQQVQKSWNDFSDSSSLSNEVRSAMCPYLLLEIRRDNLIEDTLKQLLDKSNDLKKPLKIKYTAGGEQGLDMGGLQKEFFQVVVETMFDPSYSLFTLSEDGNLAWFNAFSFESELMFELVGILLGLAIYNGIILDLHFPMIVYKKLLDFDVGVEDLVEIQPTVSSSLKQLLQFTGDVENEIGLTFEVAHSIYGAEKKIELLPDGKNIPVTNDNRNDFVGLYVDSLLNKSIERQFNAFKRGFYQVCSGPTIRLFTPPELELLICGSPKLDFKALEEVTQYKDGYSKNHAVMIDFWDIVHKFTFKQKQALLMFVTGSYRVPLKGLGSVSFFIQRNGPDSNNLPTSMTCFNRLLLPEYKSAEKLQCMLLLAIENSKGFGLA